SSSCATSPTWRTSSSNARRGAKRAAGCTTRSTTPSPMTTTGGTTRSCLASRDTMSQSDEKRIRAVACFCGARDGNRPVFRAAAQQLGQALASRGLSLVYGGGALGMMGTIADAVLDAGSRVVGVLPRGLARKEFAHERVSELLMVETMHERKATMERLS